MDGLGWEIKRYDSSKRRDWNFFADNARNSTFLFVREYMDYHSDRFEDHSLLAYRNGKLCALLPANRSGTTLFSHQGLTYGGWILPPSGLDTTEIFRLWKKWLEYCKEEGIETVVYKPLPYIYSEMPSQEDLYMLFLCGASHVASDISSAIDLEANPGYDKLQMRHLRKAPEGLLIRICRGEDEEGLENFHRLLARCLKERHEAVPVHTKEELGRLMKAFPDNIALWGLYSSEGEVLDAAVCVYETGMCAHCQYIATSSEGRRLNLMARLVWEMVEYYEERGVRYLDFGISNEEGGRFLNAGLNRQKTSYGASGVSYPRYEISVSCALERLPNELWPPK